MTQLTNWLSNISFRDPLVWVAIAAGIAIVLVFLFLGRRKARAKQVVASDNPDDVQKLADQWLPPSKRHDERRRSMRRGGVPTPVQFSDPLKPKKHFDGFVLDRSSGGLRLASERAFPTGSTMLIRPIAAAPETPWVPVIIRNCREQGDFFEIGCQFQEDLPWHLLLMFG